MNIIVRFIVPIPSARFVQTPGLIFHEWLPLEKDDAYMFQEGNLILRLWINQKCLGNVIEISDISKHQNLIVERVLVDILVLDLKKEFVDYLFGTVAENEEYRSQYDSLGERLLPLVVKKVNRLIDYCQVELGQFWLLGYNENDILKNAYQYNLKFKAQILNKAGNIRWHPPSQNKTYLSGIRAATEKERYVSEDNWPEIKTFISSEIRTSKISYMFTEAEFQAAAGQRRSALVLAIGALEQALYSFASLPNAWSIVDHHSHERVGFRSLKKWLSNYGITGALNYLLPILFSEDSISTDCLKACQDAYVMRNNIVHHASRDVSPEKIQIYLSNIKELIQFLTNNVDEEE